MTPNDFQRPGPWPSLVAGEVHVWLLELDHPAITADPLNATLSAQERQRAARFHNPQTGARYMILHKQLRQLLARYSGIPAAALQFEPGEYGKPKLPLSPLHFNISRVGPCALMGFSRDGELGVDIERHQPGIDHQLIASNYFSVHERAVLAALPKQQQANAFHQIWTRKEAYLKALGSGLSRSLDSFSSCAESGLRPPIINDQHHPDAPRHHQLRDLRMPPGYSAALVTPATTLACRLFLLDNANPPLAPAPGCLRERR